MGGEGFDEESAVMGWNDYGVYAPGAHDPGNPHCGCLDCYDPDFGGHEMSGDDLQRMWIDLIPPEFPEKGDVWIRLGEIRTWNGGWDPPLVPELKSGRRRGRTMRIQISKEAEAK